MVDYKLIEYVESIYKYGKLSKQQYKTLKGQILKGDREAAIKGFKTLTNKKKKVVVNKHEKQQLTLI